MLKEQCVYNPLPGHITEMLVKEQHMTYLYRGIETTAEVAATNALVAGAVNENGRENIQGILLTTNPQLRDEASRK